jgi:hypothetical protein
MSVALIGASGGTAGAAPTNNLQRAQRGAQWLADQIKANGGFLVNFGAADPVNTAYAVIGIRSVGVDKPAANLAIAYLQTKIGPSVQLGGHDSPGALANYIMASVSDAKDARHFGGTAAKNNLVARLLATSRGGGSDKGLFGASDPKFDAAFRQGMTLAALKAVNVPKTDPRVAAAITWLTKQQCANGLWVAYRPKTTTPCPPANSSTFTGPDTNSTAFALEGLAAWGKFPHRAAVLNSLKAVQSSDGGFPFVAAPHQASDPDSTALVIQGLIAANTSPASAMWKHGAATPYTALASYQLGCADTGYGAFTFPGNPAPNVFATVQAVPAMAGKKFPVPLSTTSVIVPLTPC